MHSCSERETPVEWKELSLEGPVTCANLPASSRLLLQKSCHVDRKQSNLLSLTEVSPLKCSSYEEKWVLPVARYRGVTFSAIQQLLHVPGRPHQLLGCAENGSFALW